jgi:hemerythrin-like metal-binding protein
MELIKWDPSFSVAHDEIDKQHKELIRIINEFYDAFMNKKDSSFIQKTLDDMARYADFHFNTEEEYFKQYNFHYAVEHKRYHDSFREQIKEFQESYKKKNGVVKFKIINYLRDWLTNHILKEDKKYMGKLK